MQKSMTGYGSGSAKNKNLSVTIEVKSVNHRFLDVSVRMPRSFLRFENALRIQVQERIKRGKVDIFVSLEQLESSGRKVKLDRGLAESYLEALTELAVLTKSEDSFEPVITMSRFNDLFIDVDDPLDEESISDILTRAMDAALTELEDARQVEGNRLTRNLLEKTDILEDERKKVEELSPRVVDQYRERLLARAEELLAEERQEWYDDQRLFAETAIFADKSAIDEEMTRLKSHLLSLSEILKGDGPSGRQLDFLIQELNREINTIGSKANDFEISQSVVTMKSVLEQIREQVQNLE
ncbi:MAG TPA: YicC/YloC family endoribonuclease [Oscillospiraceae bacterium]|nr:YicC/YloC family endoribonuclease [Oscillospiraceae bacterium]